MTLKKSKTEIYEEATKELQQIIKEEKGVVLSDREAAEISFGLLELFKIITPTKKVLLRRKKLRKK